MHDSSHQSSVTDWILAERRGLDASRQLWERYIADVVRACELRLTRNQRRSLSGEDLAQEVFHDFFVGLRSHRFTRLRDRGDVRTILTMLVDRTVIDYQRRHSSAKAGAGKVWAFSELEGAIPPQVPPPLESVAAPLEAPTNDQEVRRLLLALVPDLTDPQLQDLVCDRIKGYTVDEIARNNNVSEHAVYRKLRLVIRRMQSRIQRDP